MKTCPNSALSAPGHKIVIDRGKCVACGTCTAVCPSGAMFFYGEEKTVEEVFEEVKKDLDYYRQSGGGVTVSGGECMAQPQFVSELFRLCKADGIHTVLDTCGFFDTSLLPMIKERTDLVLYDLKLMDPQQHSRYTGVDNAVILQNLRRMVQEGFNIYIRVPVIPGINDSEDQLEAIAQFVFALNRKLHIDLLPYHRFGIRKYEMLDMDYPLVNTISPSQEQKDTYKTIFDRFGLDCTVH